MKKKAAVDYFGSYKALASALGIHWSAVYQWGDKVPELRARQLVDLTDGKLKLVPTDYRGTK